jgi:hypothetical protein
MDSSNAQNGRPSKTRRKRGRKADPKTVETKNDSIVDLPLVVLSGEYTHNGRTLVANGRKLPMGEGLGNLLRGGAVILRDPGTDISRAYTTGHVVGRHLSDVGKDLLIPIAGGDGSRIKVTDVQMVNSGPGRPSQLKRANKGGLTVANAYLNLEVMYGISRSLKDRGIPCKQAKSGVAEHLERFISSVEASEFGKSDVPEETGDADDKREESESEDKQSEVASSKEDSTLAGGDNTSPSNTGSMQTDLPSPGGDSGGGAAPMLSI